MFRARIPFLTSRLTSLLPLVRDEASQTTSPRPKPNPSIPYLTTFRPKNCRRQKRPIRKNTRSNPRRQPAPSQRHLPTSPASQDVQSQPPLRTPTSAPTIPAPAREAQAAAHRHFRLHTSPCVAAASGQRHEALCIRLHVIVELAGQARYLTDGVPD